MIIARSIWRKATVTALAAISFVALYEVTMFDSQPTARQTALLETTALPRPGARFAFSATAYCKGVTTTSGVAAQTGVAAADPGLLPVGSVIEIDSVESRYKGIYTIMDTGPAVRGRQVDLYIWSCSEALRFGRRPIRLVVLRLGWNPRATAAGFMDRLFKPRELEPLPARELPIPLVPETPPSDEPAAPQKTQN
jgi:3D (Asp-Asp-Asp) domain-containing protein